MGYKWADVTSTILLLAGGYTWGLDTLGWNPVEELASWTGQPIVAKVIYLAVGVSAIWATGRWIAGKFMKK